MNEVITLHGYKGGMYGFISGHAMNAFGFATITALLFKNRMYSFTIYMFAFTIAYSRVYLGVHFISDVLAGGLAGIVIGFIMYSIYQLYIRRINKEAVEIVSLKRIKILSIIMLSYILILCIKSTL